MPVKIAKLVYIEHILKVKRQHVNEFMNSSFVTQNVSHSFFFIIFRLSVHAIII